jgi:CHAD domain-containing protein
MKGGRRHNSALARGADSPAVKMLAASAALAGGATAMAKLGSARANGDDPGRSKPRYRLEPGESPKQGVSRVAQGEIDLTIGLLQAAPNGDGGAEAVHEARKALKRLRALVRVTRPSFDERRYRRENVTFRDAGRELSDARDAQVLLDTLEELRERFADELAPKTWARLRKELTAGAKRARASGPRGFEGVVEKLSDARGRVPGWPLPSQNGRASLAEGYERVYRRGRRALRRARKEPTPESLHALRKRAKDLWHASQLLEPACPAKMQRVAKNAHRVSDLLGDDHDLSVLLEYADRHPKLLDKAERRALNQVVERRRKALRRKALIRARRMYRRKPKRMLRRLALTQ